MANPIPFPLPQRPDQFQIDRQWYENYSPAIKYGAKIDASSIIGGNITIEDSGIPLGVFDTLDLIGFTLVDNGDGSVSITDGAGAGITALTSADGTVTLVPIAGGFDLSVDMATIDWSVANWTNFFANIDWSLFTDWSSFITSWVANVTGPQWDTFIDAFITNVDSDDVFNFLGQIAGLAKGDMLVYNGASWQLLPVGADGEVISANSATGSGLEYIASGVSTPTLYNYGLSFKMPIYDGRAFQTMTTDSSYILQTGGNGVLLAADSLAIIPNDQQTRITDFPSLPSQSNSAVLMNNFVYVISSGGVAFRRDISNLAAIGAETAIAVVGGNLTGAAEFSANGALFYIFDGTDGTGAADTSVIKEYSLAGTTLTYVKDITFPQVITNSHFTVRANGDFLMGDTGTTPDSYKRYNNSAVLQATAPVATSIIATLALISDTWYETLASDGASYSQIIL